MRTFTTTPLRGLPDHHSLCDAKTKIHSVIGVAVALRTPASELREGPLGSAGSQQPGPQLKKCRVRIRIMATNGNKQKDVFVSQQFFPTTLVYQANVQLPPDTSKYDITGS